MPLVWSNGHSVDNPRAKCDVKKLWCDPRLISKCFHPGVVKRYADGKEYANVSVWVCKNCKFGKRGDFYDGVSCEYKVKDEEKVEKPDSGE